MVRPIPGTSVGRSVITVTILPRAARASAASVAAYPAAQARVSEICRPATSSGRGAVRFWQVHGHSRPHVQITTYFPVSFAPPIASGETGRGADPRPAPPAW